MNASKLLTPIVGIGLLGAALAIAAWPAREQSATLAPASTVRVERVVSVAETRTIRFSGVARAADRARLAFTLPGRLAECPVDVGDAVARGQVIATLDAREYHLAEAAAASAKAEIEIRLAQAVRDLARVRRLADARAATAEEVEKVAAATEAMVTAVTAATARLDQGRRLVEESSLVAPFAGTITAVRLQPGEWASPGAPVVELAGGDDLEVMVEVPESVALRLRAGQVVEVGLATSGAHTTGRIENPAAAALGAGALFPIVVSLDSHPDLMPGSTIEVDLELRQDRALGVPLDAVLNPGSSAPSVFRICNLRAEQIFLGLGRLNGRLITVEGDLQEGDMVAVAGHASLAHGDAVEVLP